MSILGYHFTIYAIRFRNLTYGLGVVPYPCRIQTGSCYAFPIQLLSKIYTYATC